MPPPSFWRALAIPMFGLCIAGPVFIYYNSPTEDEIIQKYNPELRKRALEGREKRQQDFDDFVTKLKQHSASDKPIWAAAAIDEEARKKADAGEQQRVAEEIRKRREEIRRQSLGEK